MALNVAMYTDCCGVGILCGFGYRSDSDTTNYPNIDGSPENLRRYLKNNSNIRRSANQYAMLQVMLNPHQYRSHLRTTLIDFGFEEINEGYIHPGYNHLNHLFVYRCRDANNRALWPAMENVPAPVTPTFAAAPARAPLPANAVNNIDDVPNATHFHMISVGNWPHGGGNTPGGGATGEYWSVRMGWSRQPTIITRQEILAGLNNNRPTHWYFVPVRDPALPALIRRIDDDTVGTHFIIQHDDGVRYWNRNVMRFVDNRDDAQVYTRGEREGMGALTESSYVAVDPLVTPPLMRVGARVQYVATHHQYDVLEMPTDRGYVRCRSTRTGTIYNLIAANLTVIV